MGELILERVFGKVRVAQQVLNTKPRADLREQR